MKLHLKKPLAFFDLESTGTDVAKDRIVELAILKIMPDGSIQQKPEVAGERYLINPGMPIPLESSLLHGIYDQDVQGKPSFQDVSKGLYKFLHDCDLAGFNSNRFDVPLLVEEFNRAGLFFDVRERNLIDVQTIFHLMEERTLKAGYKFYCGKDLADAHEAFADVKATYDVFLAQLERYQDVSWHNKHGEVSTPIQNDMDALHKFCKRNNAVDLVGRLSQEDNGVVFNFGKHKGRTVEEVLKQEPSYYDWVMKGDFPVLTKKIMQEIKEKLPIKTK